MFIVTNQIFAPIKCFLDTAVTDVRVLDVLKKCLVLSPLKSPFFVRLIKIALMQEIWRHINFNDEFLI